MASIRVRQVFDRLIDIKFNENNGTQDKTIINMKFKKNILSEFELLIQPNRGRHLRIVRRLNRDGSINFSNVHYEAHGEPFNLCPFEQLQDFCSCFPELKFNQKKRTITYVI
jgi:hypothetical protein